VREVARELLSQVRALAPELVVFASGTARTARQQLLADTATPGKVGAINVASMRHAIGQACVMRGDSERCVDDTVLVAGSIMLAVMEMLDADRAIVSDKGLRDGVALDVYRCAPRPTANEPARVWNRRLANVATVPSNLARRD
jgi:exopolyphosphatase/pppGpp-phosphohydrolase